MSSTQVGKSYALAIGLGREAYVRPSRHPYWWVAPSYKQAAVGIDLVKELWGPVIRRGPLKSPPYTTEFLSGGRLEFRTWDDPSNLMGTSIAAGGVDEAGLLTPEAQAAISTRRSGTLGRLWYIGNPGMIAGPFRRLCSLAETDTTGTYSMHRWTWRDKRDALPPDKAAAYEAFIEQEKLSQPEYEFRRLYEAEWTSDEAAVFTNIAECTEGGPVSLDGDHTDRQRVIGVDVAQSVDYLVACAMDIGSGRCDFMERFRGIGYPQAAERLQHIQNRLRAPLVVEVNGPGVALVQELERRGVAYVPFTTTSQTKQEMILNLAASFQQKRISLAEMPPLQYELEVFRYNRMPTGNYRYEAPAGEHDDCVIALALANWGKSRSIADVDDYGWM